MEEPEEPELPELTDAIGANQSYPMPSVDIAK